MALNLNVASPTLAVVLPDDHCRTGSTGAPVVTLVEDPE